ncbi:hypothetical protein PISMIDRAFT_18496 [Pisolithus microcarpus 441]|uniref:Integrase catalytic domain-containing protein n=1 Tax=Pisolithus microcarpus 441 TaxID=765257 RepID=A0A0C9YXT8_9AGAM|nr:hypothetical protein PISMIDRAFT_18496 [Pisolithus microcarpus 441]
MPVEFRVDHWEVGDPLADLPVLPYHPPLFVPGSRFTATWAEELNLDLAKFLWPAELELDSAVPPFIDSIAKAFACHSVYSILDLMVGYDHHTIHDEYHDLTTFQTPIGTLRLTKLPMGYTNAVQIFHGDVCWILKDEIPEVTIPFINDCPIKGPKSRYQQTNGATVSAKKCVITALSIMVVGHKVLYEGRIPNKTKVQKIKDWPYCTNVTEVRGFLGLCLYCRIFIKDFTKHAHPLVELTKKDVAFKFGDEHRAAMEYLKTTIVTSPALRSIDYNSASPVIFAIDTSNITVGYILMQEDEERHYSQAKLELFGLFRALHDVWLYIFGMWNLVVEVDARYIKGMINNPDLQPNATINQWIAGILLFDFKLVHVPAAKHAAPDGLSRRPKAEEDPKVDEEEYEDWVDECGAFAVELVNRRKPKSRRLCPPEIPPSEYYSPDTLPQDVKQRDERLEVVKEFLETKKPPDGLEEKELESLVQLATRYFVKGGELWRKEPQGRHQLVVHRHKWLSIIHQAHNELGHKGIFSTRIRLLTRFWWPMLEQDVRWYIRTCHECQIRHLNRIHIPPVVTIPEPLFYKAYVDTFVMPKSNGYRYVTQARCSLTSYPEWAMLRSETGKSVGKFLFKQILCQWGAVAEIVTDSGAPYVLALDWLSKTYGIRHIHISPYNLQANGVVERQHFDVREAMVKSCEGEVSKWSEVAPTVFWAERVTIHKAMGFSPYYMAHSVHPRLPFDLIEATFLAPVEAESYSTTNLIANVPDSCRSDQKTWHSFTTEF